MMHPQRFPSFTVSITAFCLPLLGVPAARAADVIARVPTLHVVASGLQSQAQLADQLRAQGYMDVVMSAIYPSPAIPNPERNSTLTSHPEQTPVHEGWNGVAVRNGQLVQVYVDR